MANNVFQVKRTNVTGRTPNTTGSYATNSQYIAAGEFALNMADGILYSSNGSAIIEIGANNTNQRITNSITINNARNLNFQTVNTSAAVYFTQQNDDNFVFYSTNTAYGARPVFGVFANSITSNLQIYIPLQFNSGVVANNSLGSAGQVLTTSSTGVYWSSVAGTVTSVATGNGMTGGAITTTGTVSVLANTGIVANSTGTFVNATYIGTISANNASFLGGTAAASYQLNSTLSANVATLTSNNSTFAFGKTEGNLNVNSALTANNSTNLGGVAAASYVQNTDSRTLSGNLVISGTSFTPSTNTILLGNSTQRWVLSANTGSFSGAVSGITTLAAGNTTITGFANVTTSVNSALLTVGSIFIANTTQLTTTVPFSANGGTGTSGQVLTSNGATGSPYWAAAAGGGYYKGGSAAVGSLAVGGQNLFRVNANTLNTSTTFVSGENGTATGPITIASGITLTIQSGARVSIV